MCVPQRALAGNIKDKTLVNVNFDLVDVVKKSRFSVAVLAEGSAWYRLSFTTNDATSPNLKVIGARKRPMEIFALTLTFLQHIFRSVDDFFTPIVDLCTGATKNCEKRRITSIYQECSRFILFPTSVLCNLPTSRI